MSDLIRREDALKLFPDSPRPWPAHAIRAAIRALPAVQPDAREAALREAAAAAWSVEGGDRWTRSAAQDAILALIDKPATKGGA